MKRTEDRDVIESIIQRASVCRIGMCDGGRPYVVPVCFGYRDNVLYFHSGPTGRKLDLLRRNDAVCIEFDIDHQIVRDEDPCEWSMKYRSVIGFGQASFIEDAKEKKKALDIIIEHYDGQGEYSDGVLRSTTVVKIDVESFTAKVSGL